MEDEILRRSLELTADCLSIDDLGLYADGLLNPPARAAARTHLDACLHCQSELALLRAFAADRTEAGEADLVRESVARLRRREAEVFGDRTARAPRRWNRFAGVSPFLGVAAVLLIAVAGFYLSEPRAPVLPTTIDAGREITRGTDIVVGAPVGEQVAAPARFEWSAVDRAARYRVRLLEVDHHELWSAETTAAGLDIPSDVRTVIVPRKTLLWTVTAYDATGRVVAESAPQPFRVAAR
jgi:putative zinc finger protein